MAIAIPPTVIEKTYARLLKLIVMERLKPGVVLRQERLTKKLGVSINTLRSALMLLERDGLVESLPGWGVRVAVVDSEKVKEEFDLRAALECEAARLCAERATDAEMAEIERLAADADRASRELTPAGRGSEEARPDYEMHLLIMKSARSEKLLSAWKRLHLLFKLVWVDQLQASTEVKSGPGPSSEALAAALSTRDPNKAYATIRAHIERTRNIALESIQRLQQSGESDKDDDSWLGEFDSGK